MSGFVCRGCKNHFLQDKLCTTCGAGKLYDATVESQAAEIERQRAEIESLCAEIERIEKDGWHGFVHEIEKLRAENERLRAALKPFAVEAEAYDPPEGDDAEPAWASRFTCGNLRDARKAWKGEP